MESYFSKLLALIIVLAILFVVIAYSIERCKQRNKEKKLSGNSKLLNSVENETKYQLDERD